MALKSELFIEADGIMMPDRMDNYLSVNAGCQSCSEVFPQNFARWGLWDCLDEENPLDSLVEDDLQRSNESLMNMDINCLN